MAGVKPVPFATLFAEAESLLLRSRLIREQALVIREQAISLRDRLHDKKIDLEFRVTMLAELRRDVSRGLT